MNTSVLSKAVDQAKDFRANFVLSECRSPEDLVALAVAMMQQAEIIFRELGGSEKAAAQFYGAADNIATNT